MHAIFNIQIIIVYLTFFQISIHVTIANYNFYINEPQRQDERQQRQDERKERQDERKERHEQQRQAEQQKQQRKDERQSKAEQKRQQRGEVSKPKIIHLVSLKVMSQITRHVF